MVKILMGGMLHGELTVITYEGERFLLSREDGVPLAEAPRAFKLSSWAFDRGAHSVRHNYDHRLEG